MLIQGPIKLIQDPRDVGLDQEKATMTPSELVSAIDALIANPKEPEGDIKAPDEEPAGDIKGPSEEPTDHTEEPQKLIHVVPISDLRGHLPSIACWCHPTPDDELESVIVHNPIYQREKYA